MKTLSILFVFILSVSFSLKAQYNNQLFVSSHVESSYYQLKENEIVKISLPEKREVVVINAYSLTPEGKENPIKVKSFSVSNSEKKFLLFTNTKKVWRFETKGDYYYFDTDSRKLKKIGKRLPASSLMFAKFSPDEKKVAYVSNNNLFWEDLESGKVTELTKNRKQGIINGTFDWVYEEEFSCRDGFSWCYDSERIAFWQLDASEIKYFTLINYTDSIYPKLKKIEYPKVGQNPSTYRIGVANIIDKNIVWMNIPKQEQLGFVPRMAWKPASHELVILQLNRAQNKARYFMADAISGKATLVIEEKDKAWFDVREHVESQIHNWVWADDNSMMFLSEKDGWLKYHLLDVKKKTQKPVWRNKMDIITLKYLDKETKTLYMTASPNNATEKYLYSVTLNGKIKKITPKKFDNGTNDYHMLKNGQYALHSFSNYFTLPIKEWVFSSTHALVEKEKKELIQNDSLKKQIEFIQVKTKSNVTLDAWIRFPNDFDSTKKYPIVFYFYGEPAGQTVKNRFGCCDNFLYNGNISADGYITASIDCRGTPAPKGKLWRKSIYKKIGVQNILDLAEGSMKILERNYVDTNRVAVWGWSGGGSSTLNLMFQYPNLFQTGIAIAPLTNLFTYDNIYEERYMGLISQDSLPYVVGSPITYAKYLKGNLLYVHGTGDDNVHYQNGEMLFDELIRQGKVFDMMIYPNRTHSIHEGIGTRKHLSKTYTRFLKTHCPPNIQSF